MQQASIKSQVGNLWSRDICVFNSWTTLFPGLILYFKGKSVFSVEKGQFSCKIGQNYGTKKTFRLSWLLSFSDWIRWLVRPTIQKFVFLQIHGKWLYCWYIRHTFSLFSSQHFELRDGQLNVYFFYYFFVYFYQN